jgi:CheY-like chemotaxis protein
VDRLRGELHAMLPQQITLHVRLTPHLPPMLGDSAQMRQVLAQLVSNSAEALEGRGGVISVATGVVDADRSYLLGSGAEETLPEGRYLFLEVSDTGHGMDAATLASIFDPQFSTRAPTRGLGLAIVQGIVRGHHGAMQVYSKPDVGTTVRVLLPSAELARRRPGQESGTAGPATTRESEAVLVLDRDRTIRGAAARILERWGFTVLEAADLEEGLALLRHSEKVRLVLLEADLGGDDEPAATALKRLREGMQVVLAGEPNGSGNGSEAAAIVARPFGPVELVAAVRAALRGK